VLRMLGAPCIVWYHSAHFWTLEPTLQQAVQHAKLAAISRSLPFFDTISGWLALLSTSRDASPRTILRKLSGYAALILAWCAVYVTIQCATHPGEGLSGPLGVRGPGLALVIGLLQQIRGVFNTPVYYVADMMVIFAFAAAYGLALRRSPRLRGNTVRVAMAPDPTSIGRATSRGSA
jgi:hypothetical protein